MVSLPNLPNEIWSIIWKYHYKNIRLLAANKKRKINNSILRYFILYHQKHDDLSLPLRFYNYSIRINPNLTLPKIALQTNTVSIDIDFKKFNDIFNEI